MFCVDDPLCSFSAVTSCVSSCSALAIDSVSEASGLEAANDAAEALDAATNWSIWCCMVANDAACALAAAAMSVRMVSNMVS